MPDNHWRHLRSPRPGLCQRVRRWSQRTLAAGLLAAASVSVSSGCSLLLDFDLPPDAGIAIDDASEPNTTIDADTTDAAPIDATPMPDADDDAADASSAEPARP